jgi:hypothetical protein
MGDVIKNIRPLNIPEIKLPGGKIKLDKEKLSISPKDLCSIGSHEEEFKRPSADIHVRRAEVLKETVTSASSNIKKSKTSDNPKFITMLDDDNQKFNLGDVLSFLTGEKGFKETPTDTDINQTQYMKDLIGKLGSKARMQNVQDISKLNGRIPSLSELKDEFKQLASDPAVPFEYIVDGCYARAHHMCETMMKDNINCSKMFVMIEDLYGGGMLTAKNKFMNAEWWYHVAPISFAKDPKTEKVEGYIMDPSMADHPLKAEEWISMMRGKDLKIKVDITRAPQFGPVESDGENQTFEESLPATADTMKEYSIALKEIKDEYYAHHPEEIPPKILMT